MGDMPERSNLASIVKQYWGYDSFRPLQREAMDSVMAGRDSLVVLPTGGGKSLCFQAPALAMPGMAVVVSPLISLMKDQVDALKGNGIAAACINSAISNEDRTAVNNAIRQKALKLLYVAPERIVQPNFIEYLRAANPSFVVIDEAHCISHWGHDFRPDYRDLGRLREAFPELAFHGYTATATEHVRDDIVKEMRLRKPEILVGSFDRPNLVFRIARRDDGFEQAREVIERHPGESGLVYCIRRADVDTMCKRLTSAGYKALPYHAGMSDIDRKRNQEAFIKDDTDIIVATVAFGMGIDKSNVRYVVHMGMPKSLEYYQQETGRAGRDGLESECCLFYSGAEFLLWKSFIEKMEDTGVSRVALDKLRAMSDFTTRIQCRHKSIVNYFGQAYPKATCDACDVCLGHGETHEDSKAIVNAILSAVQEIGDYAGAKYTTEVLAGSKEERIFSKRHDKLATYGVLKKFNSREIRDWVEQLAGQGFLDKVGEYNVLRLSRQGQDALSGAVTPRIIKPEDKRTVARKALQSAKGGMTDGPTDLALFEVLRKVRRAKAEELSVPPFVVFSDVTLRDMARRKPRSRAAFLQVHGVGEKKAEMLATEFIAAIESYCGENPEAPVFETKPAQKKTRNPVSNSQFVANELFAKGHSIEDVAERMQRQMTTVEGYLFEYVTGQGITDPSPWVSLSTAERIRAAAAQTEDNRLKPIFEALNGEVSYSDIRVCMACQRNHLERVQTLEAPQTADLFGGDSRS
jgi:ATP-dependent DNA helicase RecQ